MADPFHFLRVVLVLEEDGEQNGNQQGVSRKAEPDIMPVFAALRGEEMIDQVAAGQASENSANTVGHHHEQALRR